VFLQVNMAIVVPTAREVYRFIRWIRYPIRGSRQGTGPALFVQICGMGTENARREVEELLDQGVEFLVLVGFCGGLTDELSVGDLVIDTQSSDEAFVDDLRRIARSSQISCHLGKIHTSPGIVTAPREKLQIGISSGAIAVDMEGAAVFEACRARNIQFRSFRVVSDTLRQRLPGALRHLTSTGRSTWRFWLALIFRFWEWPCVCWAVLSGNMAEKNLSQVLWDYVKDKGANN
jgi:nucleoside phosphorylase